MKRQNMLLKYRKGVLKLKKFLFPVLTLLNMLIIFYFSSQNGTQSNQTSAWFLQFLPFSMFIIRKLAHFSIYALLGFNMYHTLSNYNLKHSAILAILFCFLYACSDEWHQSFVANRSSQFRDVCIDTCGASIMILCNVYYKHKRSAYAKN